MFNKTKLELNPTDEIRVSAKKEKVKKHLGQEEISYYDIFDEKNTWIGTIKLTEHTNTKKPFKTVIKIEKRDKNDSKVLEYIEQVD